MGWLKCLFLAIAIASLPISTVDGGFLQKLARISQTSTFNTLVSKPISWVKQTYSGQLYTFRFAEFRNCLNESLFDPKKIITHGVDLAAYETINQPWNLRKQQEFPLAFITPKNVEDVVKAVQCGTKTKIHLVPKSGGLSFESVSWGTNTTVVLDFKNMATIISEINEDGVTVNVEPGALVADIHAHLWKNGGCGLAMSNHLTAGMAGDAIGGGHGAFSSLFGLTVDNILSLEMVDAFGEIHHVNKTNNPDLWFGLRGMGSGFIGIVTRIKLKGFKASNLELTYATLNFPIKRTQDVFDAFQQFHTWAEANDPTISRSLSITNDAYSKGFVSLPRGITVNLLHIQDPRREPKTNKSFLEAVSSIFPKNGQVNISNPNYFQFIATTGYAPINYPREVGGKSTYQLKLKMIKREMPTDDELYQLMEIFNKGRAIKRYFKIKSFFVNRLATKTELDTIGSLVKGMSRNVLVQLNSQTGSVRNHTRNENSYVHRNSSFNLSVRYEGSPKSGAVKFGEDWITKFYDGVKFLDSGETYQNYPDLDLQDPFVRYYKQDLGKLIDTKRKWDPKEYFKTELSLLAKAIRP